MKTIQEIKSSLLKISKWPWYWDEKQGPFKPGNDNSQFCADAPQIINDLIERLEVAEKTLEAIEQDSSRTTQGLMAHEALEKIR